ncbi:MAG: hypothetical protein AB8B49_01520 [Nitratireductor sp.]
MRLNPASIDLAKELANKHCALTGANGGVGESLCEHFLALAEQKTRKVSKAVRLEYISAPINVTRATAFLASDQSAYLSAKTITVDGGNVLR